MVETDKAHFFNVAGDGLFLILITFSYKEVKKMSQAGSSFYH